jgi:hypothetical protein
MSSQSRFTNARRQVVAAMFSVAAGVFIVGCAGQSSSPISPSGGSSSLAAQDDGFKGVICHATGSASNPYSGVIVGIGPNVDNPIFSNSGHLDFNGSTLDGHEHDIYIGSAPPNTKQDCGKLPPPK